MTTDNHTQKKEGRFRPSFSFGYVRWTYQIVIRSSGGR